MFPIQRKFQISSSDHKLKSRSTKNSDPITLTTLTAQNSHKSPSQRYEYNLVNAAIRGSKKKLLEALKVVTR